ARLDGDLDVGDGAVAGPRDRLHAHHGVEADGAQARAALVDVFGTEAGAGHDVDAGLYLAHVGRPLHVDVAVAHHRPGIGGQRDHRRATVAVDEGRAVHLGPGVPQGAQARLDEVLGVEVLGVIERVADSERESGQDIVPIALAQRVQALDAEPGHL